MTNSTRHQELSQRFSEWTIDQILPGTMMILRCEGGLLLCDQDNSTQMIVNGEVLLVISNRARLLPESTRLNDQISLVVMDSNGRLLMVHLCGRPASVMFEFLSSHDD